MSEPTPPLPPVTPPVARPVPATVPMVHPERDWKTADVHPAEVDNWKQHGWRLASDAPPAPPGVEMTDAELRKAIFDATGDRPGPNTKRETLLEKFAAIK